METGDDGGEVRMKYNSTDTLRSISYFAIKSKWYQLFHRSVSFFWFLIRHTCQ